MTKVWNLNENGVGVGDENRRKKLKEDMKVSPSFAVQGIKYMKVPRELVTTFSRFRSPRVLHPPSLWGITSIRRMETSSSRVLCIGNSITVIYRDQIVL